MKKLDHNEQRNVIAKQVAVLIAKVGIKDINLQLIAKACGGTKGKILHYFDTKEEIFDAAFAWSNQRALERLAEIWASDRDDVLDNGITNLLPLCEETDLEWRVKLSYWEYSLTDPALYISSKERIEGQLETIIQLIEKFQAKGIVSKDASARNITLETYDMMMGLGMSMLYYPISERRSRAQAFIDHIDAILEPGALKKISEQV